MRNTSTVKIGAKVWYAQKVGFGYIIRTGQIVKIIDKSDAGMNGLYAVVRHYISTIANWTEDILFKLDDVGNEVFLSRDGVENYIAKKKAEE